MKIIIYGLFAGLIALSLFSWFVGTSQYGAVILLTDTTSTLGTYRTNVNTSLTNLNTQLEAVSSTVSGLAVGGSNTQIQYNNAGSFAGDSNFIWTSGTQAFSITGNTFITNGFGLTIGNSSQVTGLATAEFQVLGSGGVDSIVQIGRWQANENPPVIDFIKSRNATIGSNTLILDNDVIGRIRYLPDDGTDFATVAATFDAEVDDGSPATGDIGMAFVWMQMPGGGGALVEPMR